MSKLKKLVEAYHDTQDREKVYGQFPKSKGILSVLLKVFAFLLLIVLVLMVGSGLLLIFKISLPKAFLDFLLYGFIIIIILMGLVESTILFLDRTPHSYGNGFALLWLSFVFSIVLINQIFPDLMSLFLVQLIFGLSFVIFMSLGITVWYFAEKKARRDKAREKRPYKNTKKDQKIA